ncbi:MAG: HlyC/CorC family transporter [Actinobacteria bacterium]|nr:HlyC/CorC family transporter [Actinomycetota bacterium]
MTGLEMLGVVTLVLLTGVGSVLAAAETSLTHMRRARAAVLARGDRENGNGNGPGDNAAGDRTGLLLEVLERRSRYLGPILLLLLACQLGAAGLTAVIVSDRFGGGWVAPSLLVLLLVFFVAAEIVPKTWALTNTDAVAVRMAPLASGLSRIVPLRWVTASLVSLAERIAPRRTNGAGSAISEEELLAVADRALESQAIDEEEHELVESVIAFGDTLVREVMVPRPDMVTVGSDATITEAIEVAVRSGRSRVPVEGTGTDDLVGVVHAKDLMRAQFEGRGDDPVTGLARPTHDVPETKQADDLLRQMQAERFHLAVVVDEYGGTAGIVTMEDLLEEVFGEIVDEFDSEEPLTTPLADGAMLVHGRMPVDELDELLGDVLPDGDWDTVGGLLFDALGHVPAVGEGVELAGRRFDVEQVVGRRITRVRISAPTAR